jgi:acid phosphatase type 7
MEVTRAHRGIGLALFASALIGCGTRCDVARLPATRATLEAIGRRLSRSHSEHELTVISSRAELLVGQLDRGERLALAHGYLRFHANEAVVVDVAVAANSVPFWIADQGFEATGLRLFNCDTAWTVYRKAFEPGWIGLGVNGLDRTPAAHYVVFVRSRDGGKADLVPSMLALDDQQSPTWRVATALPGASAAHDAHKPFQALPPELEGAILLQPAHAARHSALLANGRVWKTHVVAKAVPDQVAIAFGSDPARELVWTWRTSAEVASTAIRVARLPKVVEDQPSTGDEKLEGPVRVAAGESTLVEVPNLLNDPVIRRHRVAVDRLEPDTFYRYSLGDVSSDKWGPWRTVKTGPDSTRGARFLYLGDAQTGLEGWGRLLKAAYQRHPDTDFILLAGDLVDRGNERTNWDHFFLRADGVFDRVPLMPCVGNHEYLDMGPRLYRAFFELPRNGPQGSEPDLVYRFESGDTCVAVLDSTMAVFSPDAARRQAEWLDATFQRSTAAWKIVMFHHPVYPSHPWRDTPALREHWVPIFDKHHVDLVLQGHDHAYLRTYPMRGNHRVAGPNEGTIYVIAVSGDKFVDQARRDYIEVGRSGVSTYQTIDIDKLSNRLIYRAWTEDGTIVDEMVIAKPGGPNRDRSATASRGLKGLPATTFLTPARTP